MPPKPKKGKTGKGRQKIQVPLDEIDTTVLTKEELIMFCVRVNEELNVERQHSDFLRLDRDKLVNMVDIANEQLVELKAANRRLTVELGDDEEVHRKKMAANRQKLIHLSTEMDEEGLSKTMESDRLRRRENEGHRERMGQLAEDVRERKDRLAEMEEAAKKNASELQVQHAEDKYRSREKYKGVSALKEGVRNRALTCKTRELDARFGAEYEGLEKRKDEETKSLLKLNEKFTYDLNHYYGKILHHNIKVTSELKTSWQEAKKDAGETEMEVTTLRELHARLGDESEKTVAQESLLRKKLTGSARDQHQLKRVKNRLAGGVFDLDHLRWELEALKIREAKQDEWLKEERNEVEKKVFAKKKRAEEVLLAWEYIAVHLHYKKSEADSTLRTIREIYRERGLRWPAALEEVSEEDGGPDEWRYLVAGARTRGARLAAALAPIDTARAHAHARATAPIRVLVADGVFRDRTHLRLDDPVAVPRVVST